jgi:type IV pilus assembly protein PilQ
MQKIITKFIQHPKLSLLTSLWVIMLATSPILAAAKTNILSEINYSALPGDQVEIRISLDNAAVEPGSFTIDNPARIAFDFPDTKVKLTSRFQNIGVGVVRSMNIVEAGGRSRVVLNLSKLAPYQTRVDGNDVVVTLGGKPLESTTLTNIKSTSSAVSQADKSVKNIDFRRGEKGEGRIIVDLTDPNTSIDLKTRGDQITVVIKNSSISSELERRLDVIDFATPVSTIDAFNQSGDVKIIIKTAGDFEQLAYQTDNTYTIDVKPVVQLSAAEKQKNEFAFKGERLSLNFQNIEVRAVLQLIADFTDLNLITSDTVKGNVTLRLKNVPWDQALDIILRSKGLAMVKDGNVISIAPAEEVAARAKLDETIDAQAPLISETIQVNYAKATEIAPLLKAKDNSLLSERGSATVDQRTNKILIRDTAKNIDAITALVKELDVPVSQVLIEARIVLALNTFSKEIGVRFGVTQSTVTTSQTTGVSNTAVNADIAGGGVTPTAGSRYNVNLPAVSSAAGTIGLAIAKLPFGTLLDLELSAAQAEGKSETVSSPRIITANQHEALIETGTEIPYQEASSSGAATVSFKKAVLSLKVTPQITPDDRIIMDLAVDKDQPDFGNQVLGVPPIKTQSIQTQVLVDNGETVVLGGVYEQTKSTSTNRVPFFGDLPLIGALFRSKTQQDDKSELLIFVTPKLLNDKINL